jgi:putative transposase
VPPRRTLSRRATNAIESVNARIRKAVRARGHFPNEQAALKCVYMAGIGDAHTTPTNRIMRSNRWILDELV